MTEQWLLQSHVKYEDLGNANVKKMAAKSTASTAAASSAVSFGVPSSAKRPKMTSEYRPSTGLIAAGKKVTNIPKAKDRPLLAAVNEIVKFLEQDRRPFSLDELDGEYGCGIQRRVELHEAIKKHPRIAYVSRVSGNIGDSLQYRPIYDSVANKDDMLREVAQEGGHRGILRAELAQAYKGAEEDIQTYLDAREMFEIYDSKEKKKVLFFRDKEEALEVDDEFKALWINIQFTQAINMTRQLKTWGSHVLEAKTITPILEDRSKKEKRGRKRKRKTK